ARPLQTCSGGRIRTSDRRINSPLRYRCVTPEYFNSNQSKRAGVLSPHVSLTSEVTLRPTARSVSTTAYRLLWLAVLFDVLAFGVGFGWDRRWHATHPFEDFFSPPHLFIYSMHFLAQLPLIWITFMPDLRAHFGRAFRLVPFPFRVPGAIAIAGGGFVVTAIAGVFDAIWHTTFGLDETAWSFPHSMLGWGIFVAFVGIVACRIAIAEQFPIGWPSAIVFGFLLIAASIERI